METIKQIKKKPISELKKIIDKARVELKKDPVWIRVCEDHEQDPEIIDLIPIKFDDLDVTAKTIHGVIVLNYKLLCEDFEDHYSYIIHEGTHFLQQCFGDKPTQGADDGDYLSNPYEEEGFQNQIEHISNHQGDDEAEKYVEHLLDHHDVSSKKDRKDKKETLMDKV